MTDVEILYSKTMRVTCAFLTLAYAYLAITREPLLIVPAVVAVIVGFMFHRAMRLT